MDPESTPAGSGTFVGPITAAGVNCDKPELWSRRGVGKCASGHLRVKSLNFCLIFQSAEMQSSWKTTNNRSLFLRDTLNRVTENVVNLCLFFQILFYCLLQKRKLRRKFESWGMVAQTLWICKSKCSLWSFKRNLECAGLGSLEETKFVEVSRIETPLWLR